MGEVKGEVARARDLSPEEAQERVDAAFALEQKIKLAFTAVHTAWWELSEHLYAFQEAGFWSPLGYDNLDAFLAQPDLGMSRSTFFRLTQLWRELRVVRDVPVEDLADIEPSKVKEVLPAIVRGDVKPSKALGDARELGQRDLQEKYRPTPPGAKPKAQAPNGSTPLNATDEPQKVQCSTCGSWYDPDEGDTDD